MPDAPTPARWVGIAVRRVSGWGRVVPHKRGWRSRYAHPFGLCMLEGNRASPA